MLTLTSRLISREQERAEGRDEAFRGAKQARSRHRLPRDSNSCQTQERTGDEMREAHVGRAIQAFGVKRCRQLEITRAGARAGESGPRVCFAPAKACRSRAVDHLLVTAHRHVKPLLGQSNISPELKNLHTRRPAGVFLQETERLV